jgi:pilus assembly protein CpaB
MMILLAVTFGALAIFAGQKYLDRQSSRLRDVQVVQKAPEPTQTIVVAALPLRFGNDVTKQHLREIPWPESALPKGSFGKIEEIIDGHTRRVALASIAENEPILKPKITGPGQRGSLAAIIQPGMKALTVRVNDINGVAGFVLPGERVDVLLVRNVDRSEAYSDVLLQNVKVLAVDQLADESADKPALVKAVTVEVGTADAQKLTLAGTVGSLALTLRSAGVIERETARRISVEDLAKPAEPVQLPAAVYTSAPAEEAPRSTMVGVSRGMKRQEYSVPVHAGAPRAETHTASTARPKS